MSTHSSSGSSLGAAPAGLLTVIGGIVLLINVVGLFEFTGLALTIFGFIGVGLCLTVWLIPLGLIFFGLAYLVGREDAVITNERVVLKRGWTTRSVPLCAAGCGMRRRRSCRTSERVSSTRP